MMIDERPRRPRDIPEIEPREARERQRSGATLIDIREPDELGAGRPEGAAHVPLGQLDSHVDRAVPGKSQPLLLICASGIRSLFAAEALRRQGYEDAWSVAGGFQRWCAEGLPVEMPADLTPELRERYARHLAIPEVGAEGQARLLESRVLIVGAGGLGSPAALYLAAAGVGKIGIVDHDMVDRTNLQRQVLHDDGRVGMPKVESARRTLTALNPSIEIVGHQTRLTSENIEEILAGYDVVLDGADNFPTRYLVNDACVKLGLPDVHGSIFRFEGQVSVFWPSREEAPGPCYRCLFPEPPAPGTTPSCAEAGVLGVLPGVVGSIQAVEAIKLLLGIGTPLIGRLLVYDALQARFTELRIDRDPSCRYCGDGAEFPGYVDYEGFCAGRAASPDSR